MNKEKLLNFIKDKKLNSRRKKVNSSNALSQTNEEIISFWAEAHGCEFLGVSTASEVKSKYQVVNYITSSGVEHTLSVSAIVKWYKRVLKSYEEQSQE